jgi:1-deoxy-D-xylulose-5-phosphate reductoisomerase
MALGVAVLGSTGSIGRQALDVIERFPDRLRVVALAANSSAALLAAQAQRHGAEHAVLASKDAMMAMSGGDWPEGTRLDAGDAALVRLAELEGVDVVLNALVGAAGLRASYKALESGKRLALANKESLVVGGDLLGPLALRSPLGHPLLPVDSEHSAIFQCLVGEDAGEVERLWLTASGGPFKGRSRAELGRVSLAEALAHPTWRMGPKISIDSATMMNKGLEVIEAHHLFAMPYDRISVVVHPQSCVHSMVAFRDGSVKAHLGVTDMRIPIQYAFSHPLRWDAPTPPLDFCRLAGLDFEPPDLDAFGCLALALQAGLAGGTMPCAANAANEVAVATFLQQNCGFLDIERTIYAVMERHSADHGAVESLDQLEAVDDWARACALEYLEKNCWTP